MSVVLEEVRLPRATRMRRVIITLEDSHANVIQDGLGLELHAQVICLLLFTCLSVCPSNCFHFAGVYTINIQITIIVKKVKHSPRSKVKVKIKVMRVKVKVSSIHLFIYFQT